MRESGLERKIVERTKALGGISYKWVSPGHVGVPDRICLFPGGKILFVEVKRPGLKDGLSPQQKKNIERIQALGFSVWRIADLEEFERAVQTL